MEFNFFYSHIISIPAITFFITVLVKWVYVKIKTGKIDLIQSLWSWWMPSVHSGIIVSLTTAIGLKYWVTDDFFALALAITAIIIYDAINVRYEAGQHALAINEIMGNKKYKESLGHLPSEAFAGSLVWILAAVILYFI